MIEAYLRELARALPWAPRLKRRLLAEVDDHLRSSAAEVGEREAIARFGPPAEFARSCLQAYARSFGRLGMLALVGALVGLFAVIYPIPENTLPPAPWPEGAKPAALAWKQDAMLALFVAALVCGMLAGVAHRWTAPVVAAALAAIVASVGVGIALAFEWAAAVPGTPSPWWTVLAGLLLLGLSLVSAVLMTHAAALRLLEST